MVQSAPQRYKSQIPIKCTHCCHTENVTSGLTTTFYLGDKSPPTDYRPVALDCEMVGVGPKAVNAVGRISIVDYSGAVLYDVMVRPESEITDFRTRWSGIRPEDMRRAIPFTCAQEQVQRIIQGRIVVGHMIQNDFGVLHLKHPIHLVRDTAKAPYAKLLAGLPTKPNVGLRTLTLRLFGVRIQTGEHCSAEDARAAMAIYQLVEDAWETDLKDFKPRRQRRNRNQLILDPTDDDIEPVPGAKRTSQQLSASAIDLVSSNPVVDTKSRSLGSIRPTSSTSLLDDLFWPQGCDEDT